MVNESGSQRTYFSDQWKENTVKIVITFSREKVIDWCANGCIKSKCIVATLWLTLRYILYLQQIYLDRMMEIHVISG